jgi:exodeoxyribonuclease VII large subunit
MRVIERGYALVWRESDQQLVKSVGQVQPDDRIQVSVADGEIAAQVTDKSRETAGDG